MRTDKSKRCSDFFTRGKGLTTGLTLVLTIATIVVVNELMRSPAKWTHSIFRNGFTISALNWFNWFAILPLIVLEKELPILFDKGFDDWKLVNFTFLILW